MKSQKSDLLGLTVPRTGTRADAKKPGAVSQITNIKVRSSVYLAATPPSRLAKQVGIFTHEAEEQEASRGSGVSTREEKLQAWTGPCSRGCKKRATRSGATSAWRSRSWGATATAPTAPRSARRRRARRGSSWSDKVRAPSQSLPPSRSKHTALHLLLSSLTHLPPPPPRSPVQQWA